ncbi:PX domain-containing protein [Giardia muris]|uniref:PX domain-containing protein n=1 Tax=Giardia muris TaxID=5742 RepID=A0A4Z1T7U3_GIAMU|nr:PX domain-containing protein [Giardia muris]|eukprot:TNJ28561.1 PX domain-containing protein [Giardia muris]
MFSEGQTSNAETQQFAQYDPFAAFSVPSNAEVTYAAPPVPPDPSGQAADLFGFGQAEPDSNAFFGFGEPVSDVPTAPNPFFGFDPPIDQPASAVPIQIVDTQPQPPIHDQVPPTVPKEDRMALETPAMAINPPVPELDSSEGLDWSDASTAPKTLPERALALLDFADLACRVVLADQVLHLKALIEAEKLWPLPVPPALPESELMVEEFNAVEEEDDDEEQIEKVEDDVEYEDEKESTTQEIRIQTPEESEDALLSDENPVLLPLQPFLIVPDTLTDVIETDLARALSSTEHVQDLETLSDRQTDIRSEPQLSDIAREMTEESTTTSFEHLNETDTLVVEQTLTFQDDSIGRVQTPEYSFTPVVTEAHDEVIHEQTPSFDYRASISRITTPKENEDDISEIFADYYSPDPIYIPPEESLHRTSTPDARLYESISVVVLESSESPEGLDDVNMGIATPEKEVEESLLERMPTPPLTHTDREGMVIITEKEHAKLQKVARSQQAKQKQVKETEKEGEKEKEKTIPVISPKQEDKFTSMLEERQALRKRKEQREKEEDALQRHLELERLRMERALLDAQRLADEEAKRLEAEKRRAQLFDDMDSYRSTHKEASSHRTLSPDDTCGYTRRPSAHAMTLLETVPDSSDEEISLATDSDASFNPMRPLVQSTIVPRATSYKPVHVKPHLSTFVSTSLGNDFYVKILSHRMNMIKGQRPFVTYFVEIGTQRRQLHFSCRFSAVKELHNVLAKTYPTVTLPALPPDRPYALGGWKPDFIKERMARLETYLYTLHSIMMVRTSNIYRTFLRKNIV